MKRKTFSALTFLVLISFTACSQQVDKKADHQECKAAPKEELVKQKEQHPYGGWYCPDNLYGFPAVNLQDWKEVPVVNGRMPSKEETQNGSSLIFVDQEKYPNAKALDMEMPRLATFYNDFTKREEIIIVIQALNVDQDSVVGFRYLNGGNGSARLSEVSFMDENSLEVKPDSRFVAFQLNIKAGQETIWKVLTNSMGADEKAKEQNTNEGMQRPNLSYVYPKAGELTSTTAQLWYGSYYIQNDYTDNLFTEKFFLREDPNSGTTELNVVCGPFTDDYEAQYELLNQWAQSVKSLSEIF